MISSLLLLLLKIDGCNKLPSVQQLASFFLNATDKSKLTFSWHMPEASFPQDKKIEEFLRGPLQMVNSFRKPEWQSIREARDFASTLSGNNYSSYRSYNYGSYNSSSNTSTRTYSVTATPNGVGQKAHVVITKTKEDFTRRQTELDKVIQIRNRITQLLGGKRANGDEGVACTVDLNQNHVSKKPRTDVIILD